MTSFAELVFAAPSSMRVPSWGKKGRCRLELLIGLGFHVVVNGHSSWNNIR